MVVRQVMAGLGRHLMKRHGHGGAGEAGLDGVPARSALDDENDAIEWERLLEEEEEEEEEEVERRRDMWIASLETIEEVSHNLFRQQSIMETVYSIVLE